MSSLSSCRMPLMGGEDTYVFLSSSVSDGERLGKDKQ